MFYNDDSGCCGVTEGPRCMRETGRPVKGQANHPGERFWRLDKDMVLRVASSDSLEDTPGVTNNLYASSMAV